ncbi:MAG: DUF362 domain-containing protein [Anaerolineae bacterium]|nr:DUF362 domain-containing protein [Anaerolineae bacterium]
MRKFTRRQFIKLTGAAAAGLALFGAGCTPPASQVGRRTPPDPVGDQAYLAVARQAVGRGGDPTAITKAAIAALGGMGRFVKSGDDVIIKPNICVNYRTPEYAATTNPTVVATLVSLCLEAGARQVRVMDTPFPGIPADIAYTVSEIGQAVEAAGGVMEVMSPVKFVKTAIPDGRDLTEWEVYQDVLDTNVLINVPIAKTHNLARLSLGIKNLLGVITKPNQMHSNLGQRAADLASLVRPTLTVVDAVRIMTAGGPTGGSLNYVQQADTVIASHDFVAADAYAATLFDMTGADIAYIKAAADMGLGTLDLDGKVTEVS